MVMFELLSLVSFSENLQGRGFQMGFGAWMLIFASCYMPRSSPLNGLDGTRLSSSQRILSWVRQEYCIEGAQS